MKSLSPVDSIVRKKYSDLLRILLYDNTTNENIFWATDEYEHFGKKYSFNSPILPEMILDERTNPVTARSRKEIKIKKLRIRDMAEVFTPLWVCNRQLNLIDNAWFERENVFNIEKRKTWETNIKKITFPKGKKWKDYIEETRLEIACGEAPYITNRYDVRNGRFIPVKNRIGILDRKLRIVSENTNNQ